MNNEHIIVGGGYTCEHCNRRIDGSDIHICPEAQKVSPEAAESTRYLMGSCTEFECRLCRTAPSMRKPGMKHNGISAYSAEVAGEGVPKRVFIPTNEDGSLAIDLETKRWHESDLEYALVTVDSEDTNSGEIQTKASSCSSVVIPESVSLDADQPEVIGKPNTKSARDARTKAMVYVGIQTQIHALRKQRGWTQAELGARAGMLPNVVSRLERPDDNLVSVRTLVRLANAFDVPLAIQFNQRQNLHPDFIQGYKSELRGHNTEPNQHSQASPSESESVVTVDEAAELKQAVKDYFNIDPAENAAEWCAASSNLLRLAGLPVDHAPAPVVGDAGLRERLAALCHEQWSGWMRYLFERCRYDDDVIIRREDFTRWQRQMKAAYINLSESEKESDRKEADRILAVLAASPVPSKDDQEGDLK